MLLNLMRHNLFRVFHAPDDNGAGGAGHQPGADSEVTDPASDSQKTGGDKNIDDKASLENLLGTNPNLKPELDRLLGKAASTARANALKEQEAAIQAAVQEALDNEKLSAAEKKRKDDEKAAKVLADRELALKEGERKLLVVNKLADLKLPIEFREYITASDDEGIMAQIAGISAIIDKRVAEIAQAKLGAAAVDPKGNATPPAGDAAIMAEYNMLVSKPVLNATEQRKLNEVTEQVRAIRASKGAK